MLEKDWRFQAWVREHLPADKQTFSRDAVEMLLALLWKEARNQGQRDVENRKYEDHDL
jgi:hypothetical protein